MCVCIRVFANVWIGIVCKCVHMCMHMDEETLCLCASVHTCVCVWMWRPYVCTSVHICVCACGAPSLPLVSFSIALCCINLDEVSPLTQNSPTWLFWLLGLHLGCPASTFLAVELQGTTMPIWHLSDFLGQGFWSSALHVYFTIWGTSPQASLRKAKMQSIPWVWVWVRMYRN